MATTRAPWRLLLALQESESPKACLDWAAVLARQFQTELHVLRVLSDRARSNRSPCSDWIDVTHDVERTLSATRETRAWCDDILPEAVRAEQVCVRVGDFAEQVAVRARELAPDMIVLSVGSRPGAQMATLLACGSGRPVLVAREQKSKCTLLAATDLEDDAYPVLRTAAELGNHLHASVVAFHNVNWARARGRGSAGARGSSWSAIQKERLEVAADRLLYDGEVFVAEGDNPALAIVSHATDLQADTIVVGTRGRSGSGRPKKKSTAADVVERTDRSVVIVPLDDPALAWGSWQAR